jgi:2,4-diaminopentanoate dehydrogenase
MTSDIILFGVGAMGQRIARLARERGYTIRAAIDMDPAKQGTPLGRLAGWQHVESGPLVTADIAQALKGQPATVLHATASFLGDVSSEIEACLQRGHDIISIAEEMTFPHAADPAIAARLDATAKHHGARVMGTGVNPGFAMDMLVLALSVPCGRVDHIQAVRTNDLSDFGPTVLRTQGVGLTPKGFADAVAQGHVVGHVGFAQSIALIARHLGWAIDSVTETREPIISSVPRETPHLKIDAGQVAGCRHCAFAHINGREVLRLEHPQQIRPGLEGQATSDYIRITGDQVIEMQITPEIGGGAGTAAAAVNAIAYLRGAPAGLVHVTDLPLTSPKMTTFPLQGDLS